MKGFKLMYIADLFVSMIVNMFSSDLYDKMDSLHDKRKLKKFCEELNDWIKKFCNNNDDFCIVNTDGFYKFIENYKIPQLIINYYLEPEKQEKSKDVYITEIISKLKLYLNDYNNILKPQDETIVREMLIGIYEKINRFMCNQLDISQKCLKYYICQNTLENNETLKYVKNRMDALEKNCADKENNDQSNLGKKNKSKSILKKNNYINSSSISKKISSPDDPILFPNYFIGKGNNDIIDRTKFCYTIEQLFMKKVRLICITGSPGIGKTQLCHKVLRNQLLNGFENIYYIDLHGAITSIDLINHISMAFDKSACCNATKIINMLKKECVNKTILYFDNYEDVTKDITKFDPNLFLSDIAKINMNIYILISSRRSVSGARNISLTGLKENDAYILFKQWVNSNDNKLRYKNEDEKKCFKNFLINETKGLAGHPLSIILLASNTDAYRTSSELMEAWENEYNIVSKCDGTSLDACYNLSLQYLNTVESGTLSKLLWYIFIVFPNGITTAQQKYFLDHNIVTRTAFANLKRCSIIDYNDDIGKWVILPPSRRFAEHKLMNDKEYYKQIFEIWFDYFDSLTNMLQNSKGTKEHNQIVKRIYEEFESIRIFIYKVIDTHDNTYAERLSRICYNIEYIWQYEPYSNIIILNKIVEYQAENPQLTKYIAYNQRRIGQLEWYLSEYEIADAYYNRSLNYFESCNDNNGMSLVLYNLGQLQLDMGHSDKAEEYMRNAMDKAKNVGYDIGIAWANEGFGEIFRNKKKYKNSDDYLNVALDIFQQYNHSLGKAKVYKEFARLRSDEGNYQKALEYYKTALDIHTNETYSLNGKAQYYFEYAKLLMQFDTNLAENMLNSALDCYKHLCDDKQLAAVYEYFGKLEMERFEYLNAIKNNLQRSYSFYKSKDNIHGQASCLINILICMRKGNLNNEENKHFLIEAENLLSKSNELDCKITNKLNAELMKFLDVK